MSNVHIVKPLVAMLKRLIVTGERITYIDDASHTLGPTDEDWRDFEKALWDAKALLGLNEEQK